MVKSRAAMEAMAAIASARRNPRDEAAAYARIMTACKRPGLAAEATYAYTRGGSKIEGPSIRMAETLARAWGNLSYGVVELDQRDGESELMAYCWDLETNTRAEMVFRVPHSRDTKAKGKVKLTEDRDIYENNANMGSRRVRACILRIVPGDVTDDALRACDSTLKAQSGDPKVAREKMLAAFAELGVSSGMIAAKLGRTNLAELSAGDLARLRKIYTAIKDGF